MYIHIYTCCWLHVIPVMCIHIYIYIPEFMSKLIPIYQINPMKFQSIHNTEKSLLNPVLHRKTVYWYQQIHPKRLTIMTIGDLR